MKYLVCITKVAEVEVEFEDAKEVLRDMGYNEHDFEKMTRSQAVEMAVANHVDDVFKDLEYEVVVTAVAPLKEQFQNVIEPPAGYTADELERDNPYNQWMHES